MYISEENQATLYVKWTENFSTSIKINIKHNNPLTKLFSFDNL